MEGGVWLGAVLAPPNRFAGDLLQRRQNRTMSTMRRFVWSDDVALQTAPLYLRAGNPLTQTVGYAP